MKDHPLRLCTQLIEELNEREIDYLHWKSTVRLPEALAGGTDLDLRVAPASRDAFETLVGELGFITVQGGHPSPGADGCYFVGADEESGRLVHLDVVSDIQTGGYLAKAYRLQAVPFLMADPQEVCGLRIPSPDRELGLFVLRKALESASLLELALLIRERERIVLEISFLESEGASWPRALSLLCSHFTELARDEVDGFFRALSDGELLAQRRWGRRIARSLDHARTQPKIRLAIARLKSFVRKVRQKLRGRGPGWRIATPAPLIAFVGPKAAGKSTIVNDASTWLGRYFSIQKVHSGRPPATALTAPVRVVDRLFASILLPSDRRKGLSALPRGDLLGKASLSGFAFVVHSLLLAHEKRALLRRVNEWTQEGTIVISDRFPIGEWDGPKLRGGESVSGWFGDFVRAASRWERRMFEDMPRPDVIVRLHVDEAVALERNRGRLVSKGRSDEDASIRARMAEDFSIHFPGISVLEVSTSGALEEVRLEVRACLWNFLRPSARKRNLSVEPLPMDCMSV